ncbi:peptidylprolyl isomerase [Saccharopolyspora gregorii]|uniref:Peptidyl-prolyl cis-trans isomerase n=1 Tax=Saccharopolyspora gregorii TaxID=33914 RepID=A0ABP6RSV1_9PSEU
MSEPPGREQVPSNEQRRQNAKRKLERQLERRAEQAKRRRMMTLGATVLVVILAVAGVVYFINSSGESEAAPTCTYQPTPGQPAAKPVDPPESPGADAPKTQQVTLSTGQGDIPVTLDHAKAPCAANNFAHLAESKYFDDTDCHRLTTTEGLKVLQCGDPTGTGSGGPGYSFADEVDSQPTYPRGTLAMANSGPDTNGSQFFIVYGDSQLPPNYTVFGTVGEPGLQVVDKVAAAGDDTGQGDGKPKLPVHIDSAKVA